LYFLIDKSRIPPPVSGGVVGTALLLASLKETRPW
jgi:hypothetical protein